MTPCAQKLVAAGVPEKVAEKLCSLPVGVSVCVKSAGGSTCYMRKRPVYVEKEN